MTLKEFKEEGISISKSEEHPSKARFPILVTDEGTVILFNDEQFLKAQKPIDDKEEGFSKVI